MPCDAAFDSVEKIELNKNPTARFPTRRGAQRNGIERRRDCFARPFLTLVQEPVKAEKFNLYTVHIVAVGVR
jgi:hypothetical protein